MILLVLALWFAGSIANNITTKGAMGVFPFPLSVAYVGLLWQVGAGFLQRALGLGTSSGKDSKVRPSLRILLLISIGSLGNFVFHRVALKNSSVSFTHTAKSSSTVFVALLSLTWLKEELDSKSWGCIALLIAGISIATSTELQFSSSGFLAAIASAAAQAVQVVGSKVLLKQGHDKAQIYYESNLYAVGIFLPVWLLLEGPAVLQYVQEQETGTALAAVAPVVISGFALYWQEVCGFWFLTLVGPVSHAMGNGMRSLVVIAIGAWYFQTPVHSEGLMRLLNGGGVVIAVFSIMLHGWLKSQKIEKKL